MPRGIKGSGKAAAKSAEPSGRQVDDGIPRCRLDGTPMEHGNCPSCAARAKRFARITELEAELKRLKVKVCDICGAAGARKSKASPVPVCQQCRKLLRLEAKLRAELARARK